MRQANLLIKSSAVIAIIAAIAGCATPSNSSAVYDASQAQREQIVRFGTIESVRQVVIQRPQNGVGTLAGAGVGGVAGSAVGGGRGSVVGAIVGAVAGGVAGNAIPATRTIEESVIQRAPTTQGHPRFLEARDAPGR